MSYDMRGEIKKQIEWIRRTVAKHNSWRRNCLNLEAAESLQSPLVQEVFCSDIVRRYVEKGVYGGSRFIDEITDLCRNLAKKLFKAEFVDLRPITGNIAVLSWIFGLTKPGDTIITTHFGGYPLRISEKYPIKVKYFPFNKEDMVVKVKEAVDMIKIEKPRLIICGASEFLFPYPIAELSKAASETNTITIYDGSHVLGLIAGRQFQSPFDEGAQILGGNTSKTLSGPHGGISLVKDDKELYESISSTEQPSPMLLSDWGAWRIPALAIALAEMLAFGEDFAKQIIRNAKALAKSLHNEGFDVFCPHKGYTESHQVLLHNEGFCSEKGREIQKKLEAANIIVDSIVRIGTTEVTRLGMKEREMEEIAKLMRRVVFEEEPSEIVKKDVIELTRSFRRIKYSFLENADAYPDTKTPGLE